MPRIKIDELEFNSEDLSENGKAQLASLQFLEVQMRKLQNSISVYNTAKNAYAQELEKELTAVNED